MGVVIPLLSNTQRRLKFSSHKPNMTTAVHKMSLCVGLILASLTSHAHAMKDPRINSSAMRDREFDARPTCIYNAPTPDLRCDLIDTAVKFIRKNRTKKPGKYMASSVERLYLDEKGLTVDEKVIVRNICRNEVVSMKDPRLNSSAMRDREFDARPTCIYNAPTPDLRSDLIDTAVEFIRQN